MNTMIDEENYTDVDVSDIADDSENIDSLPVKMEMIDYTDTEIIQPIINTESIISELPSERRSSRVDVTKTKLPLARIKGIMKMDPDVNLVNAEAVFLVSKATELFLETISKEVYNFSKKKKLISKKDLDNVIDSVDCLCFLEGAMDF